MKKATIMKKKYIAPSIEIINMEPTSIMEVSGWTPSGDKDKDGFGVTEEDKDHPFKDDEF